MNRLRVLVVDDEPVLRSLYLDVLSDAGYEAVSADCAESALSELERRSFDLVVTDFHMPGMNGVELLEEIKRADSKMPVILLTSHLSPTTATAAIRKGAFWYLAKPVDLDVLVSKVGEALDQREVL